MQQHIEQTKHILVSACNATPTVNITMTFSNLALQCNSLNLKVYHCKALTLGKQTKGKSDRKLQTRLHVSITVSNMTCSLKLYNLLCIPHHILRTTG